MNRRIMLLVGAALGLAVAMAGALYFAGARDPGPVTKPPVGSNELPIRTVALASAPADVQAAARALERSRVAYAVKSGSQTYLIISTGQSGERMEAVRAEAQDSYGSAKFVDVTLQPNATRGERLLILAFSFSTDAEFQVNLGSKVAAIPTLYNQHGLALIDLPDHGAFALVFPEANATVTSDVLFLEGYARVFEGQFSAKLLSPKGRVIAEGAVHAAVGGPHWGSFSTALKLTERPAEATLILFDEDAGARLEVPLRLAPTGKQ
jgi:hypothetical protein